MLDMSKYITIHMPIMINVMQQWALTECLFEDVPITHDGTYVCILQVMQN